MLYFYLIKSRLYHDVLAPALADTYARRDFSCCRVLADALLERQPSIPGDSLVRAVGAGLPFQRSLWHALVSECLVYAAEDVPRLQTAPTTLGCLLDPQYSRDALQRAQGHAIQQAHFGARDLMFGAAYYRPEHAGLNISDDVARLHDYLVSVDPGRWRSEHLTIFPEHDRADELADARDWFPDLVAVYSQARSQDCVLVCETL